MKCKIFKKLCNRFIRRSFLLYNKLIFSPLYSVLCHSNLYRFNMNRIKRVHGYIIFKLHDVIKDKGIKDKGIANALVILLMSCAG